MWYSISNSLNIVLIYVDIKKLIRPKHSISTVYWLRPFALTNNTIRFILYMLPKYFNFVTAKYFERKFHKIFSIIHTPIERTQTIHWQAIHGNVFFLFRATETLPERIEVECKNCICSGRPWSLTEYSRNHWRNEPNKSKYFRCMWAVCTMKV